MPAHPLLLNPLAPPGPDRRDLYLRLAEEALATPRLSVLDKAVTPPSGTKRDWMNLADYCWPNPETPNGLPYVGRDGQANPEAARYDRPRYNLLTQAVLRLAAGWQITGRDAYAARAADLLAGWFVSPETGMNPHLRYAHHVPGEAEGRMDGLIVFCSSLPSLLDVWLLLGAAGKLRSETDQAMRRWTSALLDWLMTDPMSLDHARVGNNHTNWHDVLVAHLMLFVGRQDAARDVLSRSWITAPAGQILPSGEQPHETTRTLSAQYSLYNLRAMLSLATLGEAVDVDGWRRKDRPCLLLQAIRYLYEAAVGQSQWTSKQVEPPTWWMLHGVCRLANRVYGPQFDLDRIDMTPGPAVPVDPISLLDGWELAFLASHRQHLPADVS